MNPVPALRRLILGLAFCPAILGFAATSVDSRISAVTVYADRALVTRTASLEIPSAGPLEIVFDKLPATLVEQSLQVSGRGTAQVTILDVAARTAHLDFTPNEKVKKLEDELRALEQQKQALEDSSKLLEQQAQSLIRVESALTAPPTKDVARPTLEEFAKLLTFLNEQRTQLSSATAGLMVQRENLEAKIEAAEKQLNELRATRGRSVKTVTVRLAATTAGKLDLTLSYSLRGASWIPAYDARLRGAEHAVDLTYYGVVRNVTGESWQDVALTLSTARPSLGGGAPELTPWTVDVAPPPEALATMRQKFLQDTGAKKAEELLSYATGTEVGGTSGNFSGLRNAPEAPVEQDATALTAAVESGATSAIFQIPVPVTLASDNTAQKIGITSFKLAANLQFESTPKISETAFLHAYATNTSEYPLLAGAMNTFLDGTFVATSQLKSVMVGEKFSLALGADEGIALKRKLVNRFSEDTGLTSRSRRITYDILFTVTNNKKTAEHVVFKEGVPVSRNEKIVVKVLAPAERDTGTLAALKEVTRETDGRYVWRFDLKPGEKREWPLKFSIEYPADLVVTGLE